MNPDLKVDMKASVEEILARLADQDNISTAAVSGASTPGLLESQASDSEMLACLLHVLQRQTAASQEASQLSSDKKEEEQLLNLIDGDNWGLSNHFPDFVSSLLAPSPQTPSKSGLLEGLAKSLDEVTRSTLSELPPPDLASTTLSGISPSSFSSPEGDLSMLLAGSPFNEPPPSNSRPANLMLPFVSAAKSAARDSLVAPGFGASNCTATPRSDQEASLNGDGSPCSGNVSFEEAPRALLFREDGSLNLEFFKAFPCKNESHVHDRKNCPFHHSQRDRRRQPVTYKAEQCDDHFDLDGDFGCACAAGDLCDKCHNRHELLYHPDIYKQRFCSSYNHLECHRGRFCAFAHTRSEIRCALFSEDEEKCPVSEFFMRKFKTLWCPYGIQHDWHGCLYAHTYQDCRRSPSIHYGSEPCPYWQKDLHSADYQKRCPFGPRCPYSHGSKEQLYHPAYYKTMPCADYKTKRTCPRKHLCAFYHDMSEKRPALPATPDPETAEDSEAKVFDYTQPISAELIANLQPNFMRPPLFNLDDFEAFGHASRIGSNTGRRGSASSGHQPSPQARMQPMPSPSWRPQNYFPSYPTHSPYGRVPSPHSAYVPRPSMDFHQAAYTAPHRRHHHQHYHSPQHPPRQYPETLSQFPRHHEPLELYPRRQGGQGGRNFYDLRNTTDQTSRSRLADR